MVVTGNLVAIVAGIGTVESYDIAILVLNPDPAEEPSVALLGFRLHIEDHGTHAAQEVAPDVGEIIVLLVEAHGVEEHHVHETRGGIADVEALGEVSQKFACAFEEAL